jgi:hypothetical protein
MVARTFLKSTLYAHSLPFLGCTCFRPWHGQLLSCCVSTWLFLVPRCKLSQLVDHQFRPDSIKIVIIHKPTCHRRCKVKRFSQKVENVCESVEMSNFNRKNEFTYITFRVVTALLISLLCMYWCVWERVKRNVLRKLKIRRCKNIFYFTDTVFN